MGSARRRKLEAALEKATTNLALARAERDGLASTLDDLREHGITQDAAHLPGHADAHDSPPPNAERLAARVSELRELLTVFAPRTEEEQLRARGAVAQLQSTSERARALELQLAAAREREDRASEQAVRAGAAIADLEARIGEFEDIEAQIARFEEERRVVEASAAESEHLRSQIEDLETQLQLRAELEAKLGSAEARILELETERGAAEVRLREKVAELEGRMGEPSDHAADPARRDDIAPSDAVDESPPDPAAVDPVPVLPGDPIELRIARVQKRLEQTELRVHRALSIADGNGSTHEADPGGIVDITGHEAQQELDKLREEVALLAERATDAEQACLRAEEELAALQGRATSTAPVEDSPLLEPPKRRRRARGTPEAEGQSRATPAP